MANEVVATRLTANGIAADLWSDGIVSIWRVGSRSVGMAAGFALLDEVCLYDSSEFIRAAEVMRRAWRQSRVEPLVYFRQVMSGKRLVCHMNGMGSVGAVSFRRATHA